jgi:hypothetical protein
MKLFFLTALILLVSCNPELQQVGADKNDLVKYFKLVKTDDPKTLGEGVLIIAHAGDKRILTYYLKNDKGYSHTDVTISTLQGFHLDSVYSQTPDCKLNPDKDQPDFYNYLMINGEQHGYKLEILPREEAMSILSELSC